jgi:hypothetical protein
VSEPISAVLGTYSPVTFPDAEERAEQRAAMYPGARAEFVPPGFMGGGYWQVVHPDAEGLAVTEYLDLILPEGTTLQRKDSVREGDVIWSSHFGIRTVARAKTGGAGAGTTGFWFKIGDQLYTQSYPGDTLIPVIARVPRRRVAIRWSPEHTPIGSFGICDADTGKRFRGPFHTRAQATDAAERSGYDIVEGRYETAATLAERVAASDFVRVGREAYEAGESRAPEG